MLLITLASASCDNFIAKYFTRLLTCLQRGCHRSGIMTSTTRKSLLSPRCENMATLSRETGQAIFQYVMTATLLKSWPVSSTKQLVKIKFKIIYQPGTNGRKLDTLTRRLQVLPSKEENEHHFYNRVYPLLTWDSFTRRQPKLRSSYLQLWIMAAQLGYLWYSSRSFKFIKFDTEFLKTIGAAGKKDTKRKQELNAVSYGKSVHDEKLEVRNGILKREGLLWVPARCKPRCADDHLSVQRERELKLSWGGEWWGVDVVGAQWWGKRTEIASPVEWETVKPLCLEVWWRLVRARVRVLSAWK